MNGIEILKAPLSPCVDLLQNALNEAKAGRLSSVHLVAVPPQGGISVQYAGGQRADMVTGMVVGIVGIALEIMGPRSSILRPGP